MAAATTTIPVFKPLLQDGEYTACQRVLDLGWLGMGSFVGEFEQALETFIGAKDRRVVAVSTGHAALHLALLSMGVGRGDEVITPSFNNAADFQAILATGAQPVFCDIEDDSLCIDLNKAADLIGPKTKAIIVMDYDCILCDHDRVHDLASTYGLRVVHDAAHSFGSQYKGRPVGSFSDVTMFSFDPVKTITCIDGGALVVRSDEDVQRLHEMRLIGMSQPSSVMYTNSRAWTYDMKELGFRYHMANLHAAIGLAQLAKFEFISTTRRAAVRHYNHPYIFSYISHIFLHAKTMPVTDHATLEALRIRAVRSVQDGESPEMLHAHYGLRPARCIDGWRSIAVADGMR